MEERDKKTELLVGLFLFIGLLLLGGLILQFGSVREVLRKTYEITVPFADGTGVKEGTPVMLGGSKIGKVPHLPRLNEQFNGVIVTLEIYQEKKIPKDAKFSIGTAGLLGDAFVEIRPTGKDTESYIEPGTVLTADNVAASGSLQDTATQVGKKADLVMDDMRAALGEVKDAMGKVNKDALGADTLKHFRESIEHLNGTMTRMDTKVMGDENTGNLKSAIADIKDGAASFKTSAKNLEDGTKRLDTMFEKLDPAITKVDRIMVDLDTSIKSFKTVADNLAGATKGMKNGDGLFKSLFTDDKLKNDFSALISNMKHNGVLFYRDNADKRKTEEDEQRGPVVSPLRKPGR
ncbi:MAG: ABC-type transporter Mla maintaining outer rane lipid asymmetry, component MlaD [Verrucomicrobiaceae bacterium]|nr:ABC-type transporter Mla maintaining outer rane lipid asymmetry, component MlaD [Verrucomicrobiaceae bacterium]